ncbi:MAG: DUF1292 domain-containing protein [Aristaeellaceae bacterium]
MSENENMVELIDEETGESVAFEHLATLEYEGELYIALIPVEDAEDDDEEGSVVIMKIDTDEVGNECYVSVEDEELLEAVFEQLMALLDEEDDEQ